MHFVLVCSRSCLFFWDSECLLSLSPLLLSPRTFHLVQYYYYYIFGVVCGPVVRDIEIYVLLLQTFIKKIPAKGFFNPQKKAFLKQEQTLF